MYIYFFWNYFCISVYNVMRDKQVITPFIHEFLNFRHILEELHAYIGDYIQKRSEDIPLLYSALQAHLSPSQFSDYIKALAADDYKVILQTSKKTNYRIVT